jgi:uncharacterized protein Usg
METGMGLLQMKFAAAGYGLTTANILYRLPDFPTMLQTFVWQHYDVAPEFPELHRFLKFWDLEIEGALHSVTVAHQRLLGARDVRHMAAEFALN